MLVHIRVYLCIFMRDLSKLSAFCKKSIKLYHGRRVRLIHTTSCTRSYYMKYRSVDLPPLAYSNMAQSSSSIQWGSSEVSSGARGLVVVSDYQQDMIIREFLLQETACRGKEDEMGQRIYVLFQCKDREGEALQVSYMYEKTKKLV